MRPLSACLMLRGGPGGHLRGQEGTKELISRDQRRHPPSSAFRTRGLALPPPTPEEVWVGGGTWAPGLHCAGGWGRRGMGLRGRGSAAAVG